MPDISQQMSYLQMLQNPQSENSPIGAMRALGGAIGNAWQGYDSRNDEQDLMKTFLTQDATPETIQRFAADHPRMPVQDIYIKASTISRQKEASQMIDMTKTLQDAIAKGKPMDDKLIPTLFPNATPSQLQKFHAILQGAQQAGLNFKNLNAKDQVKLGPNEAVFENINGDLIQKAKNTVLKTPDLDTLVSKPDGTGVIRTTKENAAALMEKAGYVPYDKQTPTPLSQALADKMNERNPSTNRNYTASEAYNLVAHPPKDTKVKLYKGTGHDIQEQEFLPSEVDAAKVNGWGGTRPVFAPLKPEDVGTKEEQNIAREQLRLSRAQQSATRDLEKKYIHDSLTGQWLDDGNKPVSMTTIHKEYGELVDKYYGGKTPLPKQPTGKKALDKATAKFIFESYGRNIKRATAYAESQGYDVSQFK